MIEVRSYILVGHTPTPLEAATEPPRDPNYVGGSIELRIDGAEVLREATYDLVDQLWAYLVDAAAKLVAGCDAAFDYPDQPLRVSFAIDAARDTVTVEVGPRRGTAPRAELVRAIADGAEAAFLHLNRLLPGAYDAALRDARALRGMHGAV
ncbi:MAG TPA: hypothetical protein VGM88_34020 [Kofleriaceae bacterium]|jgi:hypothetical protein